MSPQNQLMIKRLKEEMKRMGVNARELSDMAKVGKSFVYDILSGKSANPTTHKIAAVADILGVSVPYLVSGTSNDNEIMAIAGKRFSSIPVIATQLSNDSSKKRNVVLMEDAHFFKKQWIEEKLETKPQNLRITFIKDDSMSPALVNDDMVIIDTSQDIPNPPGIFVLFDGYGLSTKRLEYIRKDNSLKILVISDNPKYSSYECDEAEIKIIGKVVWFSRRA